MSTKPGDWWDKSWNPWEGCTPVSEACQNCWALAMLKRFRDWDPGDDFLFYPDRLDIPGERKKPTRYFVGSLTDVFHEEINGLHIDQLFARMGAWSQHTFCLLTKRPQNAGKWLTPLFSNIWVGITTENQTRFDERITHLGDIPASVRFISAEPLLGPIYLGDAANWLDWVIVGGETGPKARPMHPAWVRSLRDQCRAAGIPFWFKGWGSWYHDIFVNPNSPPPKHTRENGRWLNLAGGHGFHGEKVIFVRKSRNAGRALDGLEFNELPKGAQS